MNEGIKYSSVLGFYNVFNVNLDMFILNEKVIQMLYSSDPVQILKFQYLLQHFANR
jgi:hypothetical protein